jgi:ankyrin repeat protein
MKKLISEPEFLLPSELENIQLSLTSKYILASNLNDEYYSDFEEYLLDSSFNCCFMNFTNINTKNSDDTSPLIIAIKYCSIEQVKFLLDKNASIYHRDISKNPLHIALLKKDINIIKLLLKYKALINAYNEDESCLYKTIKENELEIFELLIKSDPSEQNIFDSLKYAIKLNNLQALKLICSLFLIKNFICNKISPLMIACCYNNYEMVELLIDDTINKCDSSSASALMYASAFSDYKILELLLKKGAFTNQKHDTSYFFKPSALLIASGLLEYFNPILLFQYIPKNRKIIYQEKKVKLLIEYKADKAQTYFYKKAEGYALNLKKNKKNYKIYKVFSDLNN